MHDMDITHTALKMARMIPAFLAGLVNLGFPSFIENTVGLSG